MVRPVRIQSVVGTAQLAGPDEVLKTLGRFHRPPRTRRLSEEVLPRLPQAYFKKVMMIRSQKLISVFPVDINYDHRGMCC